MVLGRERGWNPYLRALGVKECVGSGGGGGWSSVTTKTKRRSQFHIVNLLLHFTSNF
jgi:hypothetical protein